MLFKYFLQIFNKNSCFVHFFNSSLDVRICKHYFCNNQHYTFLKKEVSQISKIGLCFNFMNDVCIFYNILFATIMEVHNEICVYIFFIKVFNIYYSWFFFKINNVSSILFFIFHRTLKLFK